MKNKHVCSTKKETKKISILDTIVSTNNQINKKSRQVKIVEDKLRNCNYN